MGNDLYLMKESYTGFYKIGRSTSVATRERTLLAQAPTIRLIATWEDAAWTEKHVHRLFQAHRQRGEWFVLDDHDIVLLYAYIEALGHSRKDEFGRGIGPWKRQEIRELSFSLMSKWAYEERRTKSPKDIESDEFYYHHTNGENQSLEDVEREVSAIKY